MLSSSELSAAIVVVDDDADTRAAIRDVLVAEGYRVRCVDDVRKALGIVRIEPPAVVIVHILSASAARRSILEEIRRGAFGAGVAVVVLTADRSLLELSGDGGIDVCLGKPVELNDLLGAVASLASRGAEKGTSR